LREKSPLKQKPGYLGNYLAYLGYFLAKPIHLGFLKNTNISFWQTQSKPTSSKCTSPRLLSWQ